MRLENRKWKTLNHCLRLTWDTEVELNSSDIADTNIIKDEPRHKPDNVKQEEAAMKKWVLKCRFSRDFLPIFIQKFHLVVCPRIVSREDITNRLMLITAITQQYLKQKLFIFSILFSKLIFYQSNGLTKMQAL